MVKLQVGHGVVLGLLIREILTFILRSFKDSMKASITNLLACESCAIPRALRRLWSTLRQALPWRKTASSASSASTSTKPSPDKPAALRFGYHQRALESSQRPSDKSDADESSLSSG